MGVPILSTSAAFVSLALVACGTDPSSPFVEQDRDPNTAVDAADPIPDAEVDAGPEVVDAGTDSCVPPAMQFPGDSGTWLLSQVGLYADIASKTLACDLLRFEPRFALWSDGADKLRWLRLPPGAQIDTQDPDHFAFPVGSVLFKEFALPGKRLETRVVARLGPDAASQTFLGTFAWREDESDAELVREGRQNVRGTEHDIPSEKDCIACHKGEPGRVLGLSAIQQPALHGSSFTQPVPAFSIADPVAGAALGYLHANCGHCHNRDYGESWRYVALTLRLSVHDSVLPESAIYRQTIGKPMEKPNGFQSRIVPRDPAASGLLARMNVRGSDQQMPPLASEHVDPAGLAAVRAWISQLSAE